MKKETPEIIAITEKREQEIALAIGFRHENGKWYFPEWHSMYKGVSQFDCPKFLRGQLEWLCDEFIDCWLGSNSTWYSTRVYCRSKGNNDCIGHNTSQDMFDADYEAIMDWIDNYFPL
jgi:hypothetical protein